MPPTLEKEKNSVMEEKDTGIMPSHGISIDLPSTGDGERPANVRHVYGNLIFGDNSG